MKALDLFTEENNTATSQEPPIESCKQWPWRVYKL